ncbi:GATA transcription factor 15 [Acorus gramineus]|uniref:GATA transcription factor 15 n=1 Tax=Acorus gramineus TaxID=55184 RepID=A0AAV9BUN8_ACOGR|nr:GATA transcription factor 15 [Acorus gramineus]
MDLIEQGFRSTDPDLRNPEAISAEEAKKSCSDCRTTKTPLWRGGPSGPKSLCNACGIRYRKKRREQLGLNDDQQMKVKKKTRGKRSVGGEKGKVSSLKLRFLGLLKRSSEQKQRGRWSELELGEEEEAAVLLMSLSCGFIHA